MIENNHHIAVLEWLSIVNSKLYYCLVFCAVTNLRLRVRFIHFVIVANVCVRIDDGNHEQSCRLRCQELQEVNCVCVVVCGYRPLIRALG